MLLACSASDDTGGQDGLRRVGRPSFAAGSICGSATTSEAGSSFPRTHQGTCSPPGRADLVCSVLLLVYVFLRYWSECLLPCSPAELGFIDPHAMLMHHGRWSALRGWAMRIAKRSSAKL